MSLKKLISVLLTAALCVTIMPCTVSAKSKSLSSQSASEFVENITIGWNLGNTLDAWDGSGLGTETSWGNPKASKKLITSVKKAGFNTIRVPVTWGGHIDANGNIDTEWLDRVQEVVDYAYDIDMFVILDSHHDKNWITLTENSYSSVSKKFCNVWKQIARRFKDYDEHLIFDAMNEPNTEGSYYQWAGGTEEEWKVLNKLYADFVKTVRNCGGNNKTRFLMLAPYGASAYYDSMKALKIPNDDRIIVSIHAYRPDSISLNTDLGLTKFTQLGKESIDETFRDINKAYISKGIPVIMGEFGFLNKGNEDECVKATQYYLKKANYYGIPCCWWDNGIQEITDKSESFAIFDRKTGAQTRPKLCKAIVDTAKERKSSGSSNSSSGGKTVKIGKNSYSTSKTGTLDLTNKKLTNSDIKNLKYMTKLSEIIISNNPKITDLSVISGLTNLKKITFHNCNVKDISFVKKLKGLTVIGAENNGITDISALSYNTKLTEAWLQNNNIKDISALKKCTALEYLDLSNSPIKSLSALSGMKKLVHLNLYNCGISSIAPLKNLTAIEYIYLDYNNLSDLTPLAKCKRLNELHASNNSLNGNLKALKGLTILTLLDISGNGFTLNNKLSDFMNNDIRSDSDGFLYYY